MTTDIASLGISVDVTQPKTAVNVLDQLAQAGGKAETATNKLSGSADNLGKTVGKTTERLSAADKASQALAASSKKVDESIGEASSKTLQFVNSLTRAAQEQDRLIPKQATAIDQLKQMALAIGAIGLAWKSYEYLKEAALLSARYETLGVSMVQVGKNVGYTTQQMNDNAAALQKTGITMMESRQLTMQLVQSHIDLAQSTKLARIAQDAAVIGGINSTEAFGRMVHGIQSAQVEILRGIGINVSFEQGYAATARTLKKTTAELTENEKSVSRVNQVLEKGKDIAGTYEAAMDTAGKQMQSMKRYTEDTKLMLGSLFDEALTIGVMAYTEHLKGTNHEMRELTKSGDLKAWGEGIASTFALLTDGAIGAVSMLQTVGATTIWLGSTVADGIKGMKSPFSHESQQTDINSAFRQMTADIWANSDKMRNALEARRATLQEQMDKDKRAAETIAGDRLGRYQGDHHQYKDDPAAPKEAKVSEYAKITEGIREKIAVEQQEMNNGEKLNAAEKQRIDLYAKIDAGIIKLTLSQKLKLDADLDDYDTVLKLKALKQSEIDAAMVIAQKRVDIRRAETAAIADYERSQAMARESAESAAYSELNNEEKKIQQYGMTRSQIEKIHVSELELRKTRYEAGSAEYRSLERQIEARKRLIDAMATTEDLDAQKAMWVSIEQAAHSAFNNILDGGQDMWIKMRESGKAMFFDWLYQMTAKKWLFDISASVSGSNVANAAMPGMAGGAASTAGSLAGLYGAGGMAGALAGGAGWVTGATTLGGSVSAATSLMALEGGFATGATMLAGALLPLVAGVAILSKLFEKGEYVKSTGSSVQYFDSTGATSSKSTLSNNFSTPEADAYVQGIKDSYTNAAKNLGISNQGGMFAYAANNSDGGKFGVQVGVGTSNYSTGELKASQESLSLEANRAVLAALQGSELPAYLKGVFDNLTATSATQAQIDAALSYAQGLKAVHDQLEDMGINGVSKAALDGLAQFSGGLANLSANLAGFNTNFLTQEEQRAKTIEGIVKALNEAGATLTAADVEGTTRETFKALVLGAKDLETEAGQKTYAALLSVQGAFASVTEEVKKTTVQVNDLAAAQQALQAAWSAEGARLDALNKTRADALITASKTVEDLRNQATANYISAQERVTAAQRNLADVLHSSVKSFQDVLDGLNGGRSAPESKASALQVVKDLEAQMRSGDTSAVGKMPAAIKAFVDLSERTSGTLIEYRRDEAYAKGLLREGIAAGNAQLKLLPVEMQKATDPLKEAYRELELATADRSVAMVTAIAMQASLTSVEKTLGERYLEAIEGLEDVDAKKLKKFYEDTMSAAADAAKVAAAAADAAAAILARLTAATSSIPPTGSGPSTSSGVIKDTTLHGAGTAMFDNGDMTTQVGTTIYASDAIAMANAYAQANGKDAALVRVLELGGTPEMLDRLRTLAGPLASFDVGSNYIPQDMPALVHRGETITPRPFVDMQKAARDETNRLLARLVSENVELRKDIGLLKKEVQNNVKESERTADNLQAVTAGRGNLSLNTTAV